MKRVVLIGGIVAALGLAAVAASAGPAVNFAGTWSMDKAKSQGLDPRMANAESVSCVITQDDKSLSIEWKITGGQPPAGGSGGGGGMGGGMGRGPAGPQSYTLDGKESTAEAMGGTNTTKATWSGDGKTLELSSVRAGNFNGNEFKFTSVDKLSLSEDGKTLTINRHRESQRGTTDSTLIFNKQ